MNNQNQNQCSHLTTMGLSVATLPVLVGLMMMKTVGQDLLEWGQESEEIFRGDRLPLLNFPHD
ncbi:hypothetical protein [Crocosphaera sp.]|uniref:hypothetical protein n=1 Tax=Crocosphaera sp. TaxID=2729996 RepID=UPI00262213D2|nr:hypothetical protein [Crocosphaera sp.]MDJ0578493.1 hypothetical protein [Crocosphaera sp.]